MEIASGEFVMFDVGFWLTSAAIVGLLGISAFFSGSETALTAASRGKLHSMADKGSKGAQVALSLTENSERLIGSILLGNNLVNILATALATNLFSRMFGDSGIFVATLIMTLLVLIFAEVLPKTYAINHSETAANFLSRPISLFVKVIAPAVFAIQFIVAALLWLLGTRSAKGDNSMATQEEIAGAIALGHVEGTVHKADRDRLLGALDLKHREVEEIMLHRSDIEMIDADADPDEIVRQCLSSPYTRLPIFKGDQENIIGVVHAKDLLRSVETLLRSGKEGTKRIAKLNIMDIAMKPYFVPETTPLDDQMREFLRRRTHFALVVDEYGALQGLITLEDILEEIVGEISDEHDIDFDEAAKRDKEGNYLVDGSMTIRDLNRAHEWSMPDDEANTVAGLVIHEAQTIPTVGQVFVFHNFRFEVVERDQNRITKLKVKPL